MAEQLRVMISSTARDLPEHRDKAMHACMRMGMFYPEMMEHLSATDATAAEVSMRMVEQADLYLGVFGSRYGYIPTGSDISVTEMEYNRAVQRDIPRLIFLMHDDHPVKQGDVEIGEGAEKLKALKERLKIDRVVGFFKSPDELLALVIQSLSERRESSLTAFHYVTDIPSRPAAFIAHPYTLLQTHMLIGRQPELNLLTDWITGKELDLDGQQAPADSVRIMTVVALGGMGKSALTWKWFDEVAPQEMKNLAGRMWWSFYESDATFENFAIRALAYVSKRTIDEVTQIPAPERETQLLAALNREPFLIVLDSFDRLLNIYSRLESPGQDSSDASPIKESVGVLGFSESGTRQLNKAANPRVGNFLRKLSNVHASRILINVRNDLADLQTETGRALPGVFVYHLNDLSDEDALHLCQQLGVTGSRDELLDFFHTFGNLPLLIQTLAGLVARHRPAPNDFDDWHRANPTPDGRRLEERTAEILSAALHALDEDVKIVLNTIAAFYVKAPVPYDTLANLLVAKKAGGGKRGPVIEDRALDNALTELEQRGLVGWDKRANVYNLHPLIRRTVLSSLTGDAKHETYENLLEYFRGLSRRRKYEEVKRLENLTAEMEHYHALIQLGQFDKAGRTFMRLLDKQLAYGLGNHRRRAKLLRLFFTRGLNFPPQYRRQGGQTFILGTIATAYLLCGQYSVAAGLYEMELEILREMETRVPHSKPVGKLISQRKMGITFGQMGKLYRADRSLRAALLETRNINDHFHEAICWQWLGILRATRGDIKTASKIFKRAEGILSSLRRSPPVGLIYAFSAQCQLWLGEPNEAQRLLEQASQSPKLNDRDWIRVKRLQGCALLAQVPQQFGGTRRSGDENILRVAEEKFNFALHKAREVTHVREEIQSLIGLAELNWRRHSSDAGRALLEDVMELAASGPDRLSHADACLLLALIERDEGNKDAAIEAATKAYRLAWCDGPPFAYHWGLEKAKKHLKELGAAEPQMPPFDESKFEPMPEVETDPEDEFHIGSSSEADEGN